MGAGRPRSWRDDVQEYTTAARAAAPQVTRSGPTRAASARHQTRMTAFSSADPGETSVTGGSHPLLTSIRNLRTRLPFKILIASLGCR